LKKALLVVAILSIFAFTAFGQEIKPFRINLSGVSFSLGGGGLGFEYAIPVGTMTLGIEADALYGSVNPWTFIGNLRLYPFSVKGDGFYTSINGGYRTAGGFDVSDSTTVGGAVGWRWILFGFLNLGIGVGAEYIMPFDTTYNNGAGISPRLEASLGVAF